MKLISDITMAMAGIKHSDVGDEIDGAKSNINTYSKMHLRGTKRNWGSPWKKYVLVQSTTLVNTHFYVV